jgi:hypothetical protein
VEDGRGVPSGKGYVATGMEEKCGEWCIIEGKWAYKGCCSVVESEFIHPG